MGWDQEDYYSLFLWESNGNGDNRYDLIRRVTDTGLLNPNRSVRVGDLDMDGKRELYVVLNEPSGNRCYQNL